MKPDLLLTSLPLPCLPSDQCVRNWPTVFETRQTCISDLSGAPSLTLGDNDYTGVLSRNTPGFRPTQPRIVEENIVLFVVGNKDTTLVSGNQDLLVVDCRLQVEIPSSFRVMAGIRKEARRPDSNVVIGVECGQGKRQAAFAARRASTIALF